ncbi:MAG TPA: phosphocholine cytidylyltransferase family protein [Chthoniobacterales bacterium]|nr:phosphocholine cytidylyltransferase family protein [Chthoniobacterales bacterium]
MNAVIYAAGKGVRLGVEHPKVLLEFGGHSLLEWHVRHLASMEVKQLLVVTGFQREAIAKLLPSLGRDYGVEIDEVVNHDFNEGSVLSFNVSLPYLTRAAGPILLMDGDVLYPAAMLRRLVDSSHPTALLLDRDYSTADDDPVLVPVKQGTPIDFRKKWSGNAELVGESVGFFKIAPADIPLLANQTKRRACGTVGQRAESYDDVLRDLVVAGRFGYEDITGLPWIEIDFPQDIERARREVLPLIESSR